MKSHLSKVVSFSTLLFMILVLSGGEILAQTSELNGTVVDPQGAVVPGADVTVTNQATGNERSAITGDEGRFRFPQLSPGLYSVRVELPGFKTTALTDIRLLVDVPKSLEVALELGEVSEVITVSGSAEVLKNEVDGSMGNAFNTEQIVDLPIESRNVYSLLSVQPGVTKEGEVAGARADQSNLTLDGIDVNEQQQGVDPLGGREAEDFAAFYSVLRVTPDSIQEFKVTTSSPDSASGRSSGGQVSLVTKSGTNEFHGSLYHFHRNTATTANNFFNNRVEGDPDGDGEQGLPTPKLLRNLYGGSIGGPIVRDKAFFFFNYEGRTDRSQDTALNETPLPHLGEGRMFYLDPDGVTQELGPDDLAQLFPATGGVNQAGLAVIADAARRYPANDSGTGDGFNVSGFRFNGSTPLDWNTFISRLDINPAQDHSLFVRANYQWDTQSQLSWWPDTPAETFWSHPFGIAAGHTWLVSPTIVNNFRYGLTRQSFSNQGDSDMNSIVFRFVYEPRDFSRTLSRTTPLHNLTNDTSWVKGDHTFTFGTNIRLIDNGRLSFANSYDSASLNPSFYAGSGAVLDVIDYAAGQRDTVHKAFTSLLGRYTDYGGNFNFDAGGNLLPIGAPSDRNFATEEYDFYFEDSWQALSNLTLNFGLRWGVNTPVYETSGFQVKPDISLGQYFDSRVWGAAQGQPYNVPFAVDLAGPFYDRPGFYETDWNNFAPRASFAYSPSFDEGILHAIFGNEGESVVRGGFAMMYDRVGSQLAVSFDLNNTLGFSSSEEVAANTHDVTANLGPLFTSLNDQIREFPLIGTPESIMFPLVKPADEAQRIESSLDDTITTPINYNWNLSFGREFWGGTFIEIGYVGRKARNLLAQRDIMHLNNIVDPASGTDWYTAAGALAQHRLNNTPIDQVPEIPFFENLFPDVPQNWWWSTDPNLSSTQNIFGFVARDEWDILDWTFLQAELDDSGVVPNMFFQPQFAALTAWSTLARSDYHGMTVSLRQRFQDSLSFDVNYTWSKSMDNASGLQNSTSYAESSFILNPLRPDDMYSVSDFDTKHILNANWLWQVPIGRGRTYMSDMSGVADSILGGWSFNGVFRWNSGLPMASPFESSRWATNWNVQSWSARIRDPNASPTKGGANPNFFTDPQFAYNSYRDALPGETGDRNVLRLQGFVSFDFGLHKAFNMPYAEGHRVVFRWEVFNATNTQRLGEPDQTRTTWALDPDPQLGTPTPSFGNIVEIQGRPRVMQFGLRYEF